MRTDKQRVTTKLRIVCRSCFPKSPYNISVKISDWNFLFLYFTSFAIYSLASILNRRHRMQYYWCWYMIGIWYSSIFMCAVYCLPTATRSVNRSMNIRQRSNKIQCADCFDLCRMYDVRQLSKGRVKNSVRKWAVLYKRYMGQGKTNINCEE